MDSNSSRKLSCANLAERKRQLIAESDALRAAVSQQMDAIEASLGWLSTGIRAGQAIKKSGLFVAGLGGLFMAWKAFRGKHAEETESNGTTRNGDSPSLLHSILHNGLKYGSLVGPLLSPIFSLFKRERAE